MDDEHIKSRDHKRRIHRRRILTVIFLLFAIVFILISLVLKEKMMLPL